MEVATVTISSSARSQYSGFSAHYPGLPTGYKTVCSKFHSKQGLTPLPLSENTPGSRGGTHYSLGPESSPSSPSIESRGPHGYGCSSCLIQDKMSCAEMRDSVVRGKRQS